jgi:hypothetical protein
MGGAFGQLLPMLLGFLIRKPKLLIVVLVLGAIWWFTAGRNGGGDMVSQLAGLSTGANFDPALYDRPKCKSRWRTM